MNILAFIPVPNCAQVSIRFQQDGQLVENVFDVVASNTGDPMSQLDADNIFEVVDDWVKNTLREYQHGSVVYREMAIRDRSSAGGATYVYPGDNGTGTAGGDAMPNEVSFALKKNIAGASSNHAGRFYHIGLNNVQTTGNIVENVAVSNLVAAYNFLRTQLSAANYPLMVASLYENNVPRTSGILYFVTSISVADAILDSQRRRGPGRGR